MMPKIVSPLLAMLVLLSTISWSMEKHLCMGRVMDVSFFHKADSCGMDKAMALIGNAADDNHCCDDETFTTQGQDDLSISWDELDIDAQTFLLVYAYSYLETMAMTSKRKNAQTLHPPPLLVYDLNVLHETFLI